MLLLPAVALVVNSWVSPVSRNILLPEGVTLDTVGPTKTWACNSAGGETNSHMKIPVAIAVTAIATSVRCLASNFHWCSKRAIEPFSSRTVLLPVFGYFNHADTFSLTDVDNAGCDAR